jgi:hypothetical protein
MLRLRTRDVGHHVDCDYYGYLLGMNDGEMAPQSLCLEVTVGCKSQVGEVSK